MPGRYSRERKYSLADICGFTDDCFTRHCRHAVCAHCPSCPAGTRACIFDRTIMRRKGVSLRVAIQSCPSPALGMVGPEGLEPPTPGLRARGGKSLFARTAWVSLAPNSTRRETVNEMLV